MANTRSRSRSQVVIGPSLQVTEVIHTAHRYHFNTAIVYQLLTLRSALRISGRLLVLIMAGLWNRAGHYIFALWFLSFFLIFFFSSSPNLSGRRLDVYHIYTSTHGVVLVQI